MTNIRFLLQIKRRKNTHIKDKKKIFLIRSIIYSLVIQYGFYFFLNSISSTKKFFFKTLKSIEKQIFGIFYIDTFLKVSVQHLHANVMQEFSFFCKKRKFFFKNKYLLFFFKNKKNMMKRERKKPITTNNNNKKK